MRFRKPAFCALIVAALPLSAQSRDLQQVFSRKVKNNTEGALAVFGISAIPTETASTLILDTGTSSDETYDFKVGQFGGGFTISDSFPLYLEGFLGWNRYDPTMLLTAGAERSRLPLKWTSFAATGGIGWDFGITDDLIFRPMVHVSLGRIQTDASVAATFVANKLGLDISVLDDGGMWVGGLGGSVGFDYNHRWENDYEVDVTLRHTHLRLEPIAGDKELGGEADAITTALWSRLRVPTGLELFERPVRAVVEGSGAYLPGDQGKILKTDWLMQFGGGMEIDLEKTWVPFLTTTRLMARYTFGEELQGFSIGLGASF